MTTFDGLIRNERVNAGIVWTLTGIVGLTAVESILTDALLWGGLGILVAGVIAAPAVVTGDWTVLVPWPLALVAALALITRTLSLFIEPAGYVTVAALAQIVVAELDAFTSIDMTRRFAVAFSVLMTMAAQGVWAIAQFYSDQWLGTTLLRSERELQWSFVIVTVVALIMGAAFEWYFKRVEHVGHDEHPQRGGSL
ncbi:hypothetical protein [Halomicrobium salinisoli]|uniref:hypothetical protein n=1 Tax=Halomicrobium salinisoli TaxID=2878391 RepID=UPI001CF0174B|nr:hypothetical protein [Halomicrobium salinisoli]